MNQNCTSWLKHIKFIHTLNHAGSIKNKDCRYSFGRFFTEKTIIAEPLPHDMLEEEKVNKTTKAKSDIE